MATEFTGGCRCGQVRYRCSAEPVFTGHCHLPRLPVREEPGLIVPAP